MAWDFNTGATLFDASLAVYRLVAQQIVR